MSTEPTALTSGQEKEMVDGPMSAPLYKVSPPGQAGPQVRIPSRSIVDVKGKQEMQQPPIMRPAVPDKSNEQASTAPKDNNTNAAAGSSGVSSANTSSVASANGHASEASATANKKPQSKNSNAKSKSKRKASTKSGDGSSSQHPQQAEVKTEEKTNTATVESTHEDNKPETKKEDAKTEGTTTTNTNPDPITIPLPTGKENKHSRSLSYAAALQFTPTKPPNAPPHASTAPSSPTKTASNHIATSSLSRPAFSKSNSTSAAAFDIGVLPLPRLTEEQLKWLNWKHEKQAKGQWEERRIPWTGDDAWKNA